MKFHFIAVKGTPDMPFREDRAYFLRACWSWQMIERMLRQYVETGSTDKGDYLWSLDESCTIDSLM